MPRLYKQVDVFTKTALKGNPVAVFFDADDLSDEQMQQIAVWTNLSETTFVLKTTNDEADYKVRIFTTFGELPFAGHPTIGTCFALLESGLIKPSKEGKIVQECKAGLVSIDILDDLITFKLPYYKPNEASDELKREAAIVLGIHPNQIITRPLILTVGPKWLVVHLDSVNTVLGLKPDMSKCSLLLSTFGITGIQTFGEYSDEGVLEARTFAPDIGEDPACGSGAASVGAFAYLYLQKAQQSAATYTLTIKQGRVVSRDAHLKVTIDGSDIYVGGHAVTCLEGKSVV